MMITSERCTKRGIKVRSTAAHRRAVPRHGDLARASATFDLWEVLGDHKAPTTKRWIAAPRPVDALCLAMLIPEEVTP